MLRESIPKVLVANRGEIAVRVFRTCREQGIRTVAVYSEGDRASLHVGEADEAVCIGQTPAVESYLRVDRVIAAAQTTGAAAIHPGYGFLSERPALVAACDAAGIIFVGPPASAMHVMGDKVRARQAMVAAGVPVVPGRDDVSDVETALSVARELDYPLMIKASAGGGGKGMRVVSDDESLRRGFASAQREAAAAFGDGRLFIERAISHARHVEIQLMADAHGNVVQVGERDCSVQRRHQKVIEEAPCPSRQMNAEVRRAMGDVACRAARAVDYRGAGTVEFLFEEAPSGPRFYFLEMNTRLQVEHPVTEAVWGRDLVLDQLRVAAGEPLSFSQSELRPRGHAIECRIYAEDPLRFLPSPGKISRLRWPHGTHIRVDAAVGEGSEVSSHYDPMIAKITVWGEDRNEAIERMRRALTSTTVLGIRTNLSFHLRVLGESDFRSGLFDTGYIAAHPELTVPISLSEDRSRSIAAAAAMVAAGAPHHVGADAPREIASRLNGAAIETASSWRLSSQWRARS